MQVECEEDAQVELKEGVQVEREVDVAPVRVRDIMSMERYAKGCTVARAIDNLGRAIKYASVILGGLAALGGAFRLADARGMFDRNVEGALILLMALVGGTLGFAFGAITQAAGELIKELFDSAVNESRFMDGERKV